MEERTDGEDARYAEDECQGARGQGGRRAAAGGHRDTGRLHPALEARVAQDLADRILCDLYVS
ncbi:hypothetical protein [Streptomyces sp. NPDC012746]|uniref:hypothetical protein n=1 Tax=Streptomyces sp. NPDC012746 TaxID=3364845 RepID=UPI0036B4D0BF